MIRLTVPSIEEDDLAAVREALASGFLVQGERVARFEAALAEYLGVEHAVAVANCTAALHLSLLGLGVGPGDRVAVATYSWPATANVIVLCGAEPLFVDVDDRTTNMDPDALEATLRQTRVKLVMPVHTFGGMAGMLDICAVADRHGVPVVEDAACALGARLRERFAGTWGAVGCFSFHPRKAITTGEGGIVATNDRAIARTVRVLRNHGIDPDARPADFVAPGYNLRMTELQAALGLTQMAKLERIIASRIEAARRYDELLADRGLQLPVALPDSRHVYQSYVVLLPSGAAGRRSEIIAELRADGVEATIGTHHLPLTGYFAKRFGHRRGDFPRTDDVAARALTLPLFEGITPDQQRRVVDALADRALARR